MCDGGCCNRQVKGLVCRHMRRMVKGIVIDACSEGDDECLRRCTFQHVYGKLCRHARKSEWVHSSHLINLFMSKHTIFYYYIVL
jgi:hypothetical protein